MGDDTLDLPLTGGQAPQEKRRCKVCGDSKPLTEFEHREYGRRRTRCKACANARNRKRYQEDPSYKAYLRDWDNRNREKKRQYGRESYQRSRKILVSWLSKTFYAIRKRDPTCTLTRFDAVEMYEGQDGRCALTGRSMLWGENIATEDRTLRNPQGAHRDSISVDRIDQSLGYARHNVRLVTFQANMARNRYSDAELLSMCEDILAHHGYVVTRPGAASAFLAGQEWASMRTLKGAYDGASD